MYVARDQIRMKFIHKLVIRIAVDNEILFRRLGRLTLIWQYRPSNIVIGLNSSKGIQCDL